MPGGSDCLRSAGSELRAPLPLLVKLRLRGFIVIEQHVFPFKVADFIVAADMNILSWAADCCNSTKVYEKGTAVTRLRQAMSQADVRLAIMPATEAVSAYLKYWSSMSKCEP